MRPANQSYWTWEVELSCVEQLVEISQARAQLGIQTSRPRQAEEPTGRCMKFAELCVVRSLVQPQLALHNAWSKQHFTNVLFRISFKGAQLNST